MPYCETQTETVVAVAVTIVPVEVEDSCISTIVIVASTFEERVVRIHKVRVILLQVYPRLFAQAYARTKRFLCLSFVFSVLCWLVLSFAQITDITLLYCETQMESDAAVAAATVPEEVEDPCISTIDIEAST